MLKNKYVLGGIIGLAFIALVGGGSWAVFARHGNGAQASLTAATESGQASGTSSDGATSNQPVTLSQPTNTGGPQLSANSSAGTSVNGTANSSGTSSASANVAKLLDPTTFTQYDKYKDAQSASYIDLQVGTGTTVAEGSQVAVLYKGWLTNGTLFDQSKAGTDGKYQAFAFTEGQHQVITGWEAALAGVKEGGVRLLIVPPAAGYGAAGQGPIPGNSVLVFQVQVVQVK